MRHWANEQLLVRKTVKNLAVAAIPNGDNAARVTGRNDLVMGCRSHAMQPSLHVAVVASHAAVGRIVNEGHRRAVLNAHVGDLLARVAARYPPSSSSAFAARDTRQLTDAIQVRRSRSTRLQPINRTACCHADRVESKLGNDKCTPVTAFVAKDR